MTEADIPVSYTQMNREKNPTEKKSLEIYRKIFREFPDNALGI